ncbi:MAG: hypothetical protein ACE37J_02650, partial [Pikeienuella sp.]|uniref:hypothetical protein n=1 Tax=Pikeienuella sp. TaxID=2831957 RepID=UPI003918880A
EAFLGHLGIPPFPDSCPKNRNRSGPVLRVRTRISRVLHAIRAGGLALERREEAFGISSGKKPSAIRMNVEVHQEPQGAPTLRATEAEAFGIHSTVFGFESVLAEEATGVYVRIAPRGLQRVLVKLRSRANFRSNWVQCFLDFATGGRRMNRAGQGLDLTSVDFFPEAETGWWQLRFEGLLQPDSGVAEVEVVALPDDGSEWTSNGSPDRGFDISEVTLSRLAWSGRDPLAPGKTVAAPSANQPAARPEPPRMVHLEKRRQLRAAYLASPEYRRIADMRDRHRGRRAFIIGNGPSIRNQDLTLLRDEVTFVTNWFVNHEQFEDISPTYMCVSSHEMFGGWGNAKPELNGEWARKMQDRGGKVHKFFSFAFADYLREAAIFPESQTDFLLFDRPKEQVDEAEDINLDLSRPMMDGYTGVITFCLPLAHHFGLKEIYLIGCDCDYDIKPDSDEKAYFYDYKQHASSTTKTESLLRVWADDGPVFRSYEIARKRFAADGVSIVNATDGGRLNTFPRLSFEHVLGMKPAGRP